MQASHSTQVLSPRLYPPGFERISNLKSVCVWRTSGPTRLVVEGSTIRNVVGGLDVFRGGTKPRDQPRKSDRYYIAESTQGDVAMCGPFKDVPHGHYPSSWPVWALPST